MLYLPKNLPAVSVLRGEGQMVGEYETRSRDKVLKRDSEHVLRILFLNIMPQKTVTELDIARVMVHPSLSVQLIPMKISGQTYKNAPENHMETFYTDFEELENDKYDGMIVTGAPIEHLPFQSVRYWGQLCRIMDWAKGHVRSTLYVCWGAQAALYHHFGIPKYQLPAKLFGIYEQQVVDVECLLLDGMAPSFPMPNSRHTEVRKSDFIANGADGLKIIAESSRSGIAMAVSGEGREVYVTGHLEYEPLTLNNEYKRDLAKGLPIDKPENYYVNETPGLGVLYSWKDTAVRFYHNWLDFYCKKPS